jgi:glycosyltransferase involved in cell wall biosynthesis
MRPLLTVLIPNFNYARYLAATVESALALEYAPKEIIVVDDGSTDGSRAILCDYESRGAIKTVFQENGGQPAALNAGFKRVRGELVYVLDSDDIVSPHMMTRVMAVWRPGMSKVQFCLESIDETGARIGSVFPNFPADSSPATLRRAVLETGEYQSPPTSGNLYAKAYLERLFPLDPQRFRFSDGPMNAVAPLYGDVEAIPEVLGQYRMHGANQWGRREFDPTVYTRAVAHNLAIDAYIAEHARALGVAFRPELSDRAPWAMQYRMASIKLGPERHPLPETAAHVMKLGLTAVLESTTLSASQKATIIPWFVLMGVAPRKLAEELAKLRFHPSYRPQLLSRALKAFGTLKPS